MFNAKKGPFEGLLAHFGQFLPKEQGGPSLDQGAGGGTQFGMRSRGEQSIVGHFWVFEGVLRGKECNFCWSDAQKMAV